MTRAQDTAIDPALWILPWNMRNVPHAVLDVLRGCNISCRACYNTEKPRLKPLDEIERELTELQRRRPLHAIGIIGGEVLLHPQLCEIVRRVRARGLHVEIFTNGVLLTRDLVLRLKEAGAETIFVHVDSGQRRPEFPAEPTLGDVQALIAEKTRLIAECGLDAGVALTAYSDRLDEALAVADQAATEPAIRYLLVTLFRNHRPIEAIEGGLETALRGRLRAGTSGTEGALGHLRKLDTRELAEELRRRTGFTPFALVGSNRDPRDPRWLSYQIVVGTDRQGRLVRRSLRGTVVEKAFLAVAHALSGRYPFYFPANPRRLRLQLFLNGVFGGGFLAALSLLWRTWHRGSGLHVTRLLFQNPAEVAEDGTVTHCVSCPDAVLRNGELVPVCLCDLADAPGGAAR